MDECRSSSPDFDCRTWPQDWEPTQYSRTGASSGCQQFVKASSIEDTRETAKKARPDSLSLIGDAARVERDTLPFRRAPGATGLLVRKGPASKAPRNEVRRGPTCCSIAFPLTIKVNERKGCFRQQSQPEVIDAVHARAISNSTGSPWMVF